MTHVHVTETEQSHVLVVAEVLRRGQLPGGKRGIEILDQHGVVRMLPDDLANGINTAEIREDTVLKGRFRHRVVVELTGFELAAKAA